MTKLASYIALLQYSPVPTAGHSCIMRAACNECASFLHPKSDIINVLRLLHVVITTTITTAVVQILTSYICENELRRMFLAD